VDSFTTSLVSPYSITKLLVRMFFFPLLMKMGVHNHM